MIIKNKNIDAGKGFDWGNTSEDYAKYRDIYPENFYQKIIDQGLCVNGQCVLDLGTGTGVLPRHMYQYGADWVGIDISKNQIRQAKLLAEQADMNIQFLEMSAEEIDFGRQTFDVVTACQCFFYFDEKKVAPLIANVLKERGRLLLLYMAWLPLEDEIAKASEALVLKFSPHWSGAGATRKQISLSDKMLKYFDLEMQDVYDVSIPFTKETWHGRMRACRGVGASLTEQELEKWNQEHQKLLDQIAPDQFEVLHYASMTILRKK